MGIESIKESINKVKTMQYGAQVGQSTDFDSLIQTKAIFDRVRRDVKKVWENGDLSPQGMAKQEREIKKQGAIDIAKFVLSFESIKQQELDEATEKAKEIISKPDKKPDDFILNEWLRKYSVLKTDLTIYGTQAATQEIVNLIRETNDPYLANILLDDFAELHGQIGKHFPKLDIQDVYTTLKQNAATDTKTQARELLAEIESLRKQSAINAMVGLQVDRTLGEEYRRILINPSKFLEDNHA